MRITPVGAFSDNYIWVVIYENQAVCIDPGEAAPVLHFLKEHGLTLTQIWVTHHHRDHTGGIAELKQVFPECKVYGNRDIKEADEYVRDGSILTFGGYDAEVWETPGHTDTHIGYLLKLSDGLHVFCGDTLFSAGCGRVFTGTAEQMFTSLQRYNSLPPETLFYPAHEYTASNLRFATRVEPGNSDIAAALAEAENTPTLPVTLAHERKVNPFLRTDKAAIVSNVADWCGQPLNSELEVFAAMREMKNNS
ncbi:hydroxyacylglutathione hydrolase [Neisseria zalophi]|uniref:Hydroxyacylglutathione hydrolase n=1 Tax=Neisseria zalophi TaxID=640030 RepID=A0A5J6Q1V0_9NEIS|nr:hydroxyacylglutathione hydrolase [Neisseria zalophi]QEY27172.1 hydroxyacylglutathione hydrolase [Neisseria zalophi]